MTLCYKKEHAGKTEGLQCLFKQDLLINHHSAVENKNSGLLNQKKKITEHLIKSTNGKHYLMIKPRV